MKLWHPNWARKIWVVVAVFAFLIFLESSWSYSRRMNQYSFEYPVGDTVMVFAAGLEYTPRADSIVQADPGLTKAELVRGFGGLDFVTRVWYEASIDRSREGFEWRFILVLCSLSSALFALTEGVLSPGGRRKPDG